MISLLGATLFGIEVPDTVMDIINVIEKICVVLMPVILAVGGVILSTIKRNNAKAELADKEKIAALDAVANRENVKPQIEENTKKLQEVSTAINFLAEVMGLAFENSTLPQDTKNKIFAIVQNVKSANTEEIVAMLKTEKEMLEQKVKDLLAQLEEKVEQTVTPEENEDLTGDTTTNTTRTI